MKHKQKQHTLKFIPKKQNTIIERMINGTQILVVDKKRENEQWK